jgi:hypothetical protein
VTPERETFTTLLLTPFHMQSLSPDILRLIFENLTPWDLAKVQAVCRTFRSVAFGIIWRSVDLSEFGYEEEDRSHEQRRISSLARLIRESPVSGPYCIQQHIRKVDITENACANEDTAFILQQCSELRGLCFSFNHGGIPPGVNRTLVPVFQRALKISSLILSWSFAERHYKKMDARGELTTGYCLQLLSCTVNLESLTLHRPNTDNRDLLDIIPTALVSLRRLKTAVFRYFKKGEIPLGKILPAWDGLKELDFSACGINGHMVRSIADHCPLLSVLFLNVYGASDEDVCYLVDGLHNLRTLKLQDGNFSNVFLKHLAVRGQKYRHLFLSTWKPCNGDGIESVAWNNLETLRIVDYNNINRLMAMAPEFSKAVNETCKKLDPQYKVCVWYDMVTVVFLAKVLTRS